MAASSYVPFIIFALLWEIAVGIIYGFYFGYQDAHLAVMNVVAGSYPFSSLGVLATQHPFPLIVIALALILVIVGKMLSLHRFGPRRRLYRKKCSNGNGIHPPHFSIFNSKLLHIPLLLGQSNSQ